MPHTEDLEHVTFRCGTVYPGGLICIHSKADGIQEQLGDEGEFTRAISITMPEVKWGHRDYEDWHIISVCVAFNVDRRPRCLASLERDGEVELLGGGIPTPKVEKIPGTGVWNDGDEIGHGYVNRIRFLGQHLYVCGSWGQIYHREADGIWTPLTAEFMADMAKRPKDREGRIQWLEGVRSRTIHWRDVRGPAENDLYAVGDHGKVYHHDGSTWTQVESHCKDDLHEIAILAPDDIWICGCNGAILRGNAKTGFRNLKPAKSAGLLYTSIHAFQGQIYLATYDDLFRWDPEQQRAMRLITGLKPPIQDANQLDSAEGVMWSFGLKDLAYTQDGKTWTRVHCPDNPKIE